MNTYLRQLVFLGCLGVGVYLVVSSYRPHSTAFGTRSPWEPSRAAAGITLIAGGFLLLRKSK